MPDCFSQPKKLQQLTLQDDKLMKYHKRQTYLGLALLPANGRPAACGGLQAARPRAGALLLGRRCTADEFNSSRITWAMACQQSVAGSLHSSAVPRQPPWPGRLDAHSTREQKLHPEPVMSEKTKQNKTKIHIIVRYV